MKHVALPDRAYLVVTVLLTFAFCAICRACGCFVLLPVLMYAVACWLPSYSMVGIPGRRLLRGVLLGHLLHYKWVNRGPTRKTTKGGTAKGAPSRSKESIPPLLLTRSFPEALVALVVLGVFWGLDVQVFALLRASAWFVFLVGSLVYVWCAVTPNCDPHIHVSPPSSRTTSSAPPPHGRGHCRAMLGRAVGHGLGRPPPRAAALGRDVRHGFGSSQPGPGGAPASTPAEYASVRGSRADEVSESIAISRSGRARCPVGYSAVTGRYAGSSDSLAVRRAREGCRPTARENRSERSARVSNRNADMIDPRRCHDELPVRCRDAARVDDDSSGRHARLIAAPTTSLIDAYCPAIGGRRRRSRNRFLWFAFPWIVCICAQMLGKPCQSVSDHGDGPWRAASALLGCRIGEAAHPGPVSASSSSMRATARIQANASALAALDDSDGSVDPWDESWIEDCCHASAPPCPSDDHGEVDDADNWVPDIPSYAQLVHSADKGLDEFQQRTWQRAEMQLRHPLVPRRSKPNGGVTTCVPHCDGDFVASSKFYGAKPGFYLGLAAMVVVTTAIHRLRGSATSFRLHPLVLRLFRLRTRFHATCCLA